MKARIVLTGAAALLALAACSRSNDSSNTTGVTNGVAGMHVNAMSAATECMSPGDMRRPVSEFSDEQRRQIVACVNMASARQVNAQLPRQVDDATRWDRVTTEGTLLTYHYTVMRSASQLPAQIGQQLETRTRAMVCGQPQMRQTIQFGGAYAYRWLDNQGQLIHETRIDAC
jgi:hypothetical protein